MTAQDNTKSCTKCGETKPLSEFYLRSAKRPDGPLRSACKACGAEGWQLRKKRGRSVAEQIARHTFDPSYPLSDEAEASIYTDTPIDPELVAAWQKRRANDRKAQMRREREARQRHHRRSTSGPKFETVVL